MATQPNIPTLKDSQKPQVKLRGLEAGATLFDRMKQFKKKDLAFILAGLGTLFLAPLAEHFMMSPESGEGRLQQGWKGSAGGRGIFDGSGGSPYEPGTTGLAPGGAIGGGSDIITPLNVRDPSALVMGPGATQQPPTNSAMPGTPPPTAPGRSDSDLKDALSASARGVGAAAKKALLPIPKVALGGSGLRGLGAVGGGGSSASAGPISSSGLVSGKAAGGGGGLNNVRSMPGFKGVARGQSSGDTGGMDALKKAAGDAASAFNRGSANAGLNEAANTAIPSGGGGGFGGNGAGGMGSTDKPSGGNQGKDAKSVGESLAFLKQKAMQEAEIARWAKEKEAWDFNLKAGQILGKGAETFGEGIAKASADKVTACIFKGWKSSDCTEGEGGVTSYVCMYTIPENTPGDKPVTINKLIDRADVGDVPKDCNDSQKNGTTTSGKTYYVDGDKLTPCQGHNGLVGLHACVANDGSKMKKPDANPGGIVEGDKNRTTLSLKGDGPSNDYLEANCKILRDMRQNLTADGQKQIDAFLEAAGKVLSVRTAVERGNMKVNGCHETAAIEGLKGGNVPLIEQLEAIVVDSAHGGTLIKSEGTLDKMDALTLVADRADPRLKEIVQEVQGTSSDPGIANRIDFFVNDVVPVQKRLADARMEAVDVKLDAKSFSSSAAADPVYVNSRTKAAAEAVKRVKDETKEVAGELAHLANAAELLKPEAETLRGAASEKGTAMSIVRRNGDIYCVGDDPSSDPQCKDNRPPFRNLPHLLTPPSGLDAKGEALNAGADMAHLQSNLSLANTVVREAKRKVFTLKQNMTSDPRCSQPACQKHREEAEAALASAVNLVKEIRAEQVAVDKSIREKVKTAAELYIKANNGE